MSARVGEPYLPGRDGIHSDHGIVWLACEHYPRRHDARRWYMDFAGCHFLDARVTVAWMVFRPRDWEEWWEECDRSTPGAFKVWRIEET